MAQHIPTTIDVSLKINPIAGKTDAALRRLTQVFGFTGTFWAEARKFNDVDMVYKNYVKKGRKATGAM